MDRCWSYINKRFQLVANSLLFEKKTCLSYNYSDYRFCCIFEVVDSSSLLVSPLNIDLTWDMKQQKKWERKREGERERQTHKQNKRNKTHELIEQWHLNCHLARPTSTSPYQQVSMAVPGSKGFSTSSMTTTWMKLLWNSLQPVKQQWEHALSFSPGLTEHLLKMQE